MDKELKWWSLIAIIVVTLTALAIIDASKQKKQFEFCFKERIRPFPEKFFIWNGMMELNQAGLYQPKCI